MNDFIELTTNDAECRICFEQQTLDNILINPCACKGTSKYVHLHCLQEWRNISDNPMAKIKCMECNEYYDIIREYQYEKPCCKIPLMPFTFLYVGGLISISYMIGLLELIFMNFDTSNIIITFEKNPNSTEYNMKKFNYPLATTSYYISVSQFFVHNLIFVVYFFYFMCGIFRKSHYFKKTYMDLITNGICMFYPQTIYYLTRNSYYNYIDYLTLANSIDILLIIYFYKHHLTTINDMNTKYNNEIIRNYYDVNNV